MSHVAYAIELRRTSWRVVSRNRAGAFAVVTAEFAETDFAQQAPHILVALEKAGYSFQSIAIVLDSSWCLSSSLPIERPAAFRDRKTLQFRLEEMLPWSAEEFVFDLVKGRQSALLIAAPVAPLSELFGQLEALGVRIQSIVPTALLVAAQLTGTTGASEPAILAFKHNSRVELVTLVAGHLSNWSSCLESPAEIAAELKHCALESGAPPRIVPLRLPELATQLANAGWEAAVENAECDPDFIDTAILDGARAICDGRIEPPIELKRDQFGGRRRNVALRPYAIMLNLAATVLLSAVIGTLVFRGHAAATEAEGLATQQVEVFREVFPNAPVPVGVKTRLESELTKLKGLQGADSLPTTAVSAISTLRILLAALPADRRFLIHEIRIEDGRLYLDSEVREHSDAEIIAQRLRTGGLEVAAPRTRRLDDKRVALRLTGTTAADSKRIGAGRP